VRIKEKEETVEKEEYDIEVIPLSFSGHSTPISDASMDSMSIQSPSPIYVVPYSPGMQPPNGFQMWMPYTNPYQATPQVRKRATLTTLIYGALFIYNPSVLTSSFKIKFQK
jgi:hypothetical protein